MNKQSIMARLTDAGAIITDSHIVYTSGKHGRAYVNKDAIYLHTATISELCRVMSAEFDADQIDVVAGPTIGGVVLSQWVTHHLNLRRKSGETLSVYSEEEDGPSGKIRVFKRGYDALISGNNVLVVEDVLNTGGSARKVVEAVKACGGNVVAVTVLCNRGNVQSSDVGDVPLHALTEVTLEAWPEEECPLCREGVPVNTKVGKGKAYLESKAGASK
jgi:orotate phosphoribosyltransferase